MPNTPANDAPYVIGAIEDAATAEYPGLLAAHVGGFDGDTINPVVVNEDGSFVAAFAVTAPSYFFNINVNAPTSGIRGFTFSSEANSEFTIISAISAASGSLAYNLIGRNAAGAVVTIPVTPVGGRVTITEAIRASFPPGLSLELSISGLAPNSPLVIQQQAHVVNFHDQAGPTVEVPPIATVSTFATGGNGSFFLPNGLIQSFTLENAASWTSGATVFRLNITTPQPIDLTGFSGTVDRANVLSGGRYQSVLVVAPQDGEVAVPPTILQQLQSLPGVVVLSVSGAVVGSAPQVQATVELPVTTISEGLYTQHFDANGNPTGEAVRVDLAANALIGRDDEETGSFVMSNSADGGIIIAWLGNDDADGVADAVYVRRLDDTGNPVGDTVALSGLDANAVAAILEDGESHGALAGLADGGFALAYTVEAPLITGVLNGTTTGAPLSLSGLTGQLDRVELTQSTASGAVTAHLRGESPSGAALAVSVPLVGGVFQMTDALRVQFAPASHLSLAVTGLTPGTPYTAILTSRDIFDFDTGSTLTTANRTAAAANNPLNIPDVFVTTGEGQAISYQVNAVTGAAGPPPVYTLSLFTSAPIDVTGQTLYSGPLVAGVMSTTANSNLNDAFLTTIVVTPVAGTVAIPPAFLAQIDGDSLRSILGISGLQAGTTTNVDITLRQPSSISVPGVFVQTFDAAGASEGPAQRIEDADSSLAQNALPNEGEPALSIQADADGGYRVTWIANSNDGSGVDRIVSREFGAEGAVVGTAIDISSVDIPGVVEANAAGAEINVPDHMQMVELGNDGFAALVQVEVNTISGPVTLVADGGPLFVGSGARASDLDGRQQLHRGAWSHGALFYRRPGR